MVPPPQSLELALPIAVLSPEAIMLETKRDICFIEFFFPGKRFTYLPKFQLMFEENYFGGEKSTSEEVDYKNPPGRQEFIEWFAKNLPNTKWEMLAPPERSGILVGGLKERICIYCDDESLKRFCNHWEIDNVSIDPRFQVGYLMYDSYMKDYPGPPDYDD